MSGHCCRGETVLTLSESLRLSHAFPIAVTFHIADEAAFAYPGYRQHVEQMGFWVDFGLGGGRKLTRLVMGVFNSSIPTSLPCPALDGLLCSLHEEKPANCSAVPVLDVAVPLGLQAMSAEIKKKEMIAQGCQGYRRDATVIIRHGKVVDPGYRNAYDAYLSEARANVALMNEYFVEFCADSPQLVGQWVQAMSRSVAEEGAKSLFIFQGLCKMVPFLRKKNILSAAEGVSVIRQQASAIRRVLGMLPQTAEAAHYRRLYEGWLAETEVPKTAVRPEQRA